MNGFFVDTLNVSKMNNCVFVPAGTGQKIHTNRPNHGLVFQLSGKKKYVFADGAAMLINQGELFYLPKFSNYEVVDLEAGDCIAVNFDLSDTNITYPYFVMSNANKEKHLYIFKDLLTEWNQYTAASINKCYLHLYELICDIQAEATAKYLPFKTKKIAIESTEYIALHIHRHDLTVENVAKFFDITPEYFRKIFKSVLGLSPKKYMIMLRMEKAKELIASREYSISQVSRMCGYEYECYFSRDFKKHIGILPSAYVSQIESKIQFLP